MHAAAVRAVLAPYVGGARRHVQAFVVERVFEPKGEGEGIAGLRAQGVLERDPFVLALRDRPRDPADQAVNGVASLDLVERELVARAAELVGTVLDPVRPRNEHLPAAGARHLLDVVAAEDVLARDGVGPQPGTDLGDDNPVIPGAYLDLFAGRKGIRHQAAAVAVTPVFTSIRSSRWSPTRSEFAIAVSAGF